MDGELDHFSTSAPVRGTIVALTNGEKPEFSSSEKERLIREIQNTDRKREVVDFDVIDSKFKSPRQRRKSLHPSDERQARDPRDEARGAVVAEDEAHYTQV